MKKCIVIIFLLINSGLFAQSDILWQKCYGGTNLDAAYCIRRTFDNGFVVAGYTNSDDGNVSVNKGGYDCWILRLDSMGDIVWQRTYGGTDDDQANYIHETSDGGYIVCGYTESNDSDVTGNHGLRDFWIFKINDSGDLQWQKSFGGTGNERSYSIFQTNDLGYAVAGYSDSDDGNVTFNHGFQDYWILKLDNNGNIQWQHSYGGQNTDEATTIQPTLDGGYIVAGASFSTNGNVTGHHSNNDIWIVKLDSSGTLKWQKSLGGSQDDLGRFAKQTSDGGYIVGGFTNSYDGDITSLYDENDFWILKLDSTGAIIWQKTIGGSLEDYAYSLEETLDGGYLISGTTNSVDGAIAHNNGMYDFFIVKMDTSGNIQWKENYGGTNLESAASAVQTNDGGYVIAGNTYSNDLDVNGNHGSSDVWIVKLSSATRINDIQYSVSDFSVSPNPVSSELNIMFNVADKKNIEVVIRNAYGGVVKKFDDKLFNKGKNNLRWDVKNISSNVSAGVYFVTLKSDKFSETKKVEVIKD